MRGEADELFSREIGKDQVEGPPADCAKGTLLYDDPAISPIPSDVLGSDLTGEPVCIQSEDPRGTESKCGNRQKSGARPKIQNGWSTADG